MKNATNVTYEKWLVSINLLNSINFIIITINLVEKVFINRQKWKRVLLMRFGMLLKPVKLENFTNKSLNLELFSIL